MHTGAFCLVAVQLLWHTYGHSDCIDPHEFKRLEYKLQDTTVTLTKAENAKRELQQDFLKARASSEKLQLELDGLREEMVTMAKELKILQGEDLLEFLQSSQEAADLIERLQKSLAAAKEAREELKSGWLAFLFYWMVTIPFFAIFIAWLAINFNLITQHQLKESLERSREILGNLVRMLTSKSKTN